MIGSKIESTINENTHYRRSKYLNQLQGRFYISGVSGSMFKQQLRLSEWKDKVITSSDSTQQHSRQNELMKDAQRLLELHERLLIIQKEKQLREQRNQQREKGKLRW